MAKKMSKRDKAIFALGCRVGARNAKKTHRSSYRKRTARNYY